MSRIQLKNCLPQTERIVYLSVLFTSDRKCGIMWPEEGSSWPVWTAEWITATDNSFSLHADMQELFHDRTKSEFYQKARKHH